MITKAFLQLFVVLSLRLLVVTSLAETDTRVLLRLVCSSNEVLVGDKLICWVSIENHGERAFSLKRSDLIVYFAPTSTSGIPIAIGIATNIRKDIVIEAKELWGTWVHFWPRSNLAWNAKAVLSARGGSTLESPLIVFTSKVSSDSKEVALRHFLEARDAAATIESLAIIRHLGFDTKAVCAVYQRYTTKKPAQPIVRAALLHFSARRLMKLFLTQRLRRKRIFSRGPRSNVTPLPSGY